MQVTVLGEHPEHIPCLVGKEDVVRHDDRSPSAWFQDGHDVLDEIELLVAGRDREVVPVRCLVCPFRPEWGIGHDNIEPPAVRDFVDGIAEFDLRFKVVEIEVHQGKTAGTGDEFLPEIGAFPDTLCDVPVEGSPFRLADQPFIRRDKESPGPAARIADGKFAVCTGIGFHAPDNGLDEQTGSEILACPLLPLARRLLK